MAKSSYLEKRREERIARQNRNRKIAAIAIVALLAVVAFIAYKIINNNSRITVDVNTQFSLSKDAVMTDSGLIYDDLIIGEGPTAKIGDAVGVKYSGYLSNGQFFDSNVETDELVEFVLGDGTTMPGWDEGIVGMRVGGARLLVIPPQLVSDTSILGYSFPEGETITYSITLKEIK